MVVPIRCLACFLFGLMTSSLGLVKNAWAQTLADGLKTELIEEAEFDLSVEQFRVLENQAWPPEVTRPEGADPEARLWHCDVGDPDSPPLWIVSSSDNSRLWVDRQRDGQWTEITEKANVSGSPTIAPSKTSSNAPSKASSNAANIEALRIEVLAQHPIVALLPHGVGCVDDGDAGGLAREY